MKKGEEKEFTTKSTKEDEKEKNLSTDEEDGKKTTVF